MVLTRRQALAQIKNQPTNQATTATFEVDGEPSMDVVCKDAAEGSADIYVTSEGTVTDNGGALQTCNHKENDQTDRSPSAQPQEEFDHQGDNKENKGGLKSFQPQTNESPNPSTSIQSNEGNSANSASLLNEEGKEPDVHRRHRERTVSRAPTTELTPSEVVSTEAEAKIESKQVEKDEEARGENNIEESPAEGSVRRSQRVRRPTQRYIAATRNADSGRGKRESTKEDTGRQRSTQTRGSPKRKRCDSSTTDEDFAGQEETRRIRRRTDEDDSALVWPHMTLSQYAWMWRLDHQRIALRPREEVPVMGSWNRFTVPRPVSAMRDINEERWRALIQVAVEAKKLEV